MGNGFEVSVGELRAHAAAVEGVAGQVRSAGTSAQTSLGADSFGEIGQFFATTLMAASEQLRELIGTSSQAVTDVRTGLNAAADTYERVDDAHAQVFRLDGADAVTTAQATGAAEVGQRDKAIAVLERISEKHPISVATVAVRQVRWFRGWMRNIASATIGDHYEKDIPHLLAKPPTDANLREVADTETRYWNSDRGNPLGMAVSADRRYSMLVSARTEWLNEMPPAQREQVARQLGVRLER